MSVTVEPRLCNEIEYTFLGIAVTNNCNSRSSSSTTTPPLRDHPAAQVALQLDRERAKAERKARSRRRTRALARRLVKGVFKFPLCCRRPSTLGGGDDGDDEFTVTEYSKHLPYAPRKVPEASNQLVPYKAPEIRSPHLPHVQRKATTTGSQLQRKVIIYPPNSGPMTSTNGQWKIGFENANRWESPLQGWSLTGDAYLGVGEPGLDFDSRDDAVNYAKKYGWSYRVDGEKVKHDRSQSMGTFGWVELMRPAVRT